MKRIFSLIAICAIAGATGTARAGIINVGAGEDVVFTQITANGAPPVASQFSVQVMDGADANALLPGPDLVGSQVLFVFRNAVGTASSIAEIYFDDNGPAGTPMANVFDPPPPVQIVVNSLGGFTDFRATPLKPGDLPAGATVGFSVTHAFGADAQGHPSKGIDASTDAMGIIMHLDTGVSFDDLAEALLSGRLRIGLHVHAIGGDESESFVTAPAPPSPSEPVPEPGSLVLLGTGIAALLGARRIRRS